MKYVLVIEARLKDSKNFKHFKGVNDELEHI